MITDAGGAHPLLEIEALMTAEESEERVGLFLSLTRALVVLGFVSV